MAENGRGIPQSAEQIDNGRTDIAGESLEQSFAPNLLSVRDVLIFVGALFVIGWLIYLIRYRRQPVMAENSPVIPQNDAQITHAVGDIPAESLNRGFEARPLNMRGVIVFMVALFATACVIFVVLWWLVGSWQHQALTPRMQVPPVNATIQPAPGAFPVVNAAGNLQDVVKPALANLSSYGWVDQKAGVVRIPIDQAMTLLLQRGLPVRNAKPPSFGLDPAHQMAGNGGQDPRNEFTMR